MSGRPNRSPGRQSAVRLAAVGDLHCPRTPPDVLAALLRKAADEADLVLLCVDLTDRGLEEEARTLARILESTVRVPVVAVLGNHDFDAGQAPTVRAALAGLLLSALFVRESYGHARFEARRATTSSPTMSSRPWATSGSPVRMPSAFRSARARSWACPALRAFRTMSC